jgi:hypothetical protein
VSSAAPASRPEMKARRSRDKHMRRIAAAQTPRTKLIAATSRILAILKRATPEQAGQIADDVVAALNRIADDADNEYAGRGRRGWTA